MIFDFFRNDVIRESIDLIPKGILRHENGEHPYFSNGVVDHKQLNEKGFLFHVLFSSRTFFPSRNI
jgi:hypothetical protein